MKSLFLKEPVIIEIYTDKMQFTVFDHKGHQTNQITIVPEKPYASERMLIGYFENAEACMNKASKQLGYNILKKKPTVTVKPKEKLEGGLSVQEEWSLKELCMLFGGMNIEVVE